MSLHARNCRVRREADRIRAEIWEGLEVYEQEQACAAERVRRRTWRWSVSQGAAQAFCCLMLLHGVDFSGRRSAPLVENLPKSLVRMQDIHQ